MDLLNQALPVIDHLQFYNYLIIIGVFFIESIIFVSAIIPGALITFLMGVLAAEGYLNVYGLIIAALLGAIAGEYLSYYIGVKGKLYFSNDNRILKLSYLEAAEDFFARHGSLSIILGRFIGPIKIFIPFTAGLSKMKAGKFLVLNFLSLLVWTIFYVALGFFFGQAWGIVKLWSTRAEILLLALLFFFSVLYGLERLLAKRGKKFFIFLASLWQSISRSVSTHPDVVRFTTKHEKFFSYARARLDRKNFYGLPLTLLCLSFIYILFLFLGIIEDLLTADLITGLDIRIENLLQSFRNLSLIRTFLLITVLGKWQVIAVFTLALSAYLWLSGRKNYLLPLWLSIAGSQIFTFLGKITIQRGRPPSSYYLESSFSFPSAHATIAMVFYGFFGYVLWRAIKSWRRKFNSLFGIALVISLIGFSRLYLGVHYLSDVLAGYTLGALWLIIGVSIVEWLHDRSDQTPAPIIAVNRYVVAFLAAVPLIFFSVYGYEYRPEPNLSNISYGSPLVTQSILADIDRYHLSKYSEKLDGSAQEPLAFIVSAPDDAALIAAFRQAGWYTADPVNLNSVLKIAEAAMTNANYPTAPMTPSFWQAEVNNFSFEKPTVTKSVRERHHARFWKTNFVTPNGRIIYVGVASLDIGVKYWVTHRIDPDIDTEREYLFRDLKDKKTVASFSKHPLVDPVLGSNASGDQFFTDGEVYIIDLR